MATRLPEHGARAALLTLLQQIPDDALEFFCGPDADREEVAGLILSRQRVTTLHEAAAFIHSISEAAAETLHTLANDAEPREQYTPDPCPGCGTDLKVCAECPGCGACEGGACDTCGGGYTDQPAAAPAAPAQLGSEATLAQLRTLVDQTLETDA